MGERNKARTETRTETIEEPTPAEAPAAEVSVEPAPAIADDQADQVDPIGATIEQLQALEAAELTAYRPRWEYNVLRRWSNEALEAHLNELGADGWELVGTLGVYPVFKRQIAE